MAGYADKVTAQVAVEAIVNFDGEGYDTSTMSLVLAHARGVGVAAFYTDMLAALVDARFDS